MAASDPKKPKPQPYPATASPVGATAGTWPNGEPKSVRDAADKGAKK